MNIQYLGNGPETAQQSGRPVSRSSSNRGQQYQPTMSPIHEERGSEGESLGSQRNGAAAGISRQSSSQRRTPVLTDIARLEFSPEQEENLRLIEEGNNDESSDENEDDAAGHGSESGNGGDDGDDKGSENMNDEQEGDVQVSSCRDPTGLSQRNIRRVAHYLHRRDNILLIVRHACTAILLLVVCTSVWDERYEVRASDRSALAQGSALSSGTQGWIDFIYSTEPVLYLLLALLGCAGITHRINVTYGFITNPRESQFERMRKLNELIVRYDCISAAMLLVFICTFATFVHHVELLGALEMGVDQSKGAIAATTGSALPSPPLPEAQFGFVKNMPGMQQAWKKMDHNKSYWPTEKLPATGDPSDPEPLYWCGDQPGKDGLRSDDDLKTLALLRWADEIVRTCKSSGVECKLAGFPDMPAVQLGAKHFAAAIIAYAESVQFQPAKLFDKKGVVQTDDSVILCNELAFQPPTTLTTQQNAALGRFLFNHTEGKATTIDNVLKVVSKYFYRTSAGGIHWNVVLTWLGDVGGFFSSTTVPQKEDPQFKKYLRLDSVIEGCKAWRVLRDNWCSSKLASAWVCFVLLLFIIFGTLAAQHLWTYRHLMVFLEKIESPTIAFKGCKNVKKLEKHMLEYVPPELLQPLQTVGGQGSHEVREADGRKCVPGHLRDNTGLWRTNFFAQYANYDGYDALGTSGPAMGPVIHTPGNVDGTGESVGNGILASRALDPVMASSAEGAVGRLNRGIGREGRCQLRWDADRNVDSEGSTTQRRL